MIPARSVSVRPAYIVSVTPGLAWRASSAASTGVRPFASATATRLWRRSWRPTRSAPGGVQARRFPALWTAQRATPSVKEKEDTPSAADSGGRSEGACECEPLTML